MTRARFCTAALAAAVVLVAVSPAAVAQGRLVAIDSGRALFEINPATGAKTAIGTASSNAGTTGGLAYNPAAGTVYLSSTSLDSLFTLDLSTGAATLIGGYGNSAVVMHGLEYNPDSGTLFGGSSHNSGVYTIDPTTGTASLVGVTGLGNTGFLNFGYVPGAGGAGTLYMTNTTTDSLYTVDQATGAATLVGALNGPTNPHGLTYNADNGQLYLIDSSTDNLYTIDLTTGAATVIGSTAGTTGNNLLGLVYIPPVPEPGAALLAAAAAVAAVRPLRRAGMNPRAGRAL